MLYYIVRPLTRWIFKVWYKKVYVSGAAQIPKEQAVLFALNHPTIFIEPCLMACFQPRDLYFLAKGVVFVTPFKKILRSLHIIPVYRFKDGGFAQIKTNLDTFEYCYQALGEDKAILLMPEGSSKQVRQIRPMTRGIARLSYHSLLAHQIEDLLIIPVGVNFSDPKNFRTEVLLKIGQPLAVADYREVFLKDERKGQEVLLRDLHQGMKDSFFHLDDLNDTLLYEDLVQLFPSENTTADAYFKHHKKISKAINAKSKAEKKRIEMHLAELKNLYNREGISPFFKVQHDFSYFKLFSLILALPFALIGLILNFIPYQASKFAGTKANDAETRMSVIIASCLIIYSFLGMFLAMLFIVQQKFLLLLLLPLIPLLGLWYVKFYEDLIFLKNAYQVKKMNEATKEKIRKLIAQIQQQLRN